MDWIEIAKEIGFTTAASLDPTKLQVRKDVRDMPSTIGHSSNVSICRQWLFLKE